MKNKQEVTKVNDALMKLELGIEEIELNIPDFDNSVFISLITGQAETTGSMSFYRWPYKESTLKETKNIIYRETHISFSTPSYSQPRPITAKEGEYLAAICYTTDDYTDYPSQYAMIYSFKEINEIIQKYFAQLLDKFSERKIKLDKLGV